MKVAVVGGGPGGLYFACQMKLRDPSHEITLFERNAQGNTFGWGVVFSDDSLQSVQATDPHTHDAITARLAHWDDIDVVFRAETVRSGGHGFSGISRKHLLHILEQRAQELGVELRFEHGVTDPAELEDFDLIVAADGVNSRIRKHYQEQFQPDFDVRTCKYVWLGTTKQFEAFTFLFEETEHGWFQAHCYRFDDQMSTFIVEAPEETWRACGLDGMSKEEGIRFCERLFADHLDGHALISNADHLRGSAIWVNFHRVSCAKWHHQNVVLLGDAAATAHFSIGSGTKLAIESAIALADVIHESASLNEAFETYQETRRIEVLRLQSAARNSTEWFEQVELRDKFEPKQFAYSLVTRSQRVSHENLRLRDSKYLEEFEFWLEEKETGSRSQLPVPPMFLPLALRDMQLPNRVACSPMAMYSAIDGNVDDFHLVHFGARALGGAGLLFTEMTCVSADARITPGCAGIYCDENLDAWRPIVEFVHDRSPARIAMQLGHAGRKGSTRVAWEGMDRPLAQGNWPIYGPSPNPWSSENQVPIEMTRDDMKRVRGDFVAAAKRADALGIDMVEVHCAHGYLLSSFISPITNTRQDAYGGTLENRMRYPLEVIDAVREVWSPNKPLSVRISAADWVPDGIDIEDTVAISTMLKHHDVDAVDVSTGQVTPDQKPVYGRMYQVPFAERARLESGITTMAVGNIYEPDHCNSIIASGRADLCLIARTHLWSPNWTQRAAAELGYRGVEWPRQYESGRDQLERLEEREREAEQSGPV